MPKDQNKKDFYKRELLNDFLKFSSLRESLIIDPEISQVKNIDEKIVETHVVMNGKNEIIRLPEIEAVECDPQDEPIDLEGEESEPKQEDKIMSGRRIVDIDELGRRLWCGTCKEALSLDCIEKECRRGLGSLLMIRCHKCLVINEVTTSKTHDLGEDKRAQRFDINTDLALCLLNNGISMNMLNRIFTHFKIPIVNPKTYKNYFKEIGEEEIAAIKARQQKFGQPGEDES